MKAAAMVREMRDGGRKEPAARSSRGGFRVLKMATPREDGMVLVCLPAGALAAAIAALEAGGFRHAG